MPAPGSTKTTRDGTPLALLASAGDYTAVGVAVNLAARLCSIAEPQEVLITAETLMRVGAGVVSEAGPPVLLKGLETPIVPYSVRRLDPPRTER